MNRLPDGYFTSDITLGFERERDLYAEAPVVHQGHDGIFHVFINYNGKPLDPEEHRLEVLVKKTPHAEGVLLRGILDDGITMDGKPGWFKIWLKPQDTESQPPGLYYVDVVAVTAAAESELRQVVYRFEFAIELANSSPQPKAGPVYEKIHSYNPETRRWHTELKHREMTIPGPYDITKASAPSRPGHCVPIWLFQLFGFHPHRHHKHPEIRRSFMLADDMSGNQPVKDYPGQRETVVQTEAAKYTTCYDGAVVDSVSGLQNRGGRYGHQALYFSPNGSPSTEYAGLRVDFNVSGDWASKIASGTLSADDILSMECLFDMHLSGAADTGLGIGIYPGGDKDAGWISCGRIGSGWQKVCLDDENSLPGNIQPGLKAVAGTMAAWLNNNKCIWLRLEIMLQNWHGPGAEFKLGGLTVSSLPLEPKPRR